MLSDRKASELISQSLARDLTKEETEEIDKHLAADANSRAFARISRVIQSSLSDVAVMAESGDASIAPAMPVATKQRLTQSLRLAAKRQQEEDRDAGNSSTGDSSTSKLSRGMILASALLLEGYLTEEQMFEALAGWKPNAGNTFGEYLVQQEFIAPKVLQGLETQGLESKPGASGRLSNAGVKGEKTLPVGGTLSGTCDLAPLSMLPDAAPPASDSRKLVSRFTLIRKLSQGGLGSIWLARDEKLKRTVAIKEMNVDASESTTAWQRFHREAEITGLLEHPHIVPLYQFGSDPQTGQPFYAMRFVGKRTLADAIIEYHEKRQAGDDDALELHRLLSAFIGICQAIAYAHSRGVIHRDLKPENVALDNFGQVIVLDWGLAKWSDEAELATQLTIEPSSDESTLACTRDGDVIGTPLYMSPEQAAGDLNSVDERTDIYGLGAILFAILTGCAPHENSNTSQDGKLRVKELLKSIAEGETPVPRDFNPRVPADLESICSKAMASKPYTRYATASLLADEVQCWMAGQQEKRQQYNLMRMEGRELRANLQSLIRDFRTNVRFMASLPPIQEIIDARSGTSKDEENVWRERLATIFKGLLQASTDYTSITFSHVDENKIEEIVRVERHSTERANVRSVPLSRLTKTPTDQFSEAVVRQKPDEVFVALPALTEPGGETPVLSSRRQLSAGVPVFDERTEEPFGIVTIECDLQRILERETRDRLHTAQQVIVLEPNCSIWVHDSRASGLIKDSIGKLAEEVIPGFENISNVVTRRDEFMDATNQEIYATCLNLAAGEPGLVFVLLRKPFVC